MKMDLAEWRGQEAQQHLADGGTEWRFIIPAAPFHGRLWKAAVRSLKKHLLKAVGKQIFAFNHSETLLVRIEGILNSRPLIALRDDLESGLALTSSRPTARIAVGLS